MRSALRDAVWALSREELEEIARRQDSGVMFIPDDAPERKVITAVEGSSFGTHILALMIEVWRRLAIEGGFVVHGPAQEGTRRNP